MIVGSLCTGYGGLELSLPWPHEVAWQSETDKHTSALLAERFPGVPNLGDLTAVAWEAVEPVDVLVAGFPCQPVSHAGKRRGTDDERWLLDDIADAAGRMAAPPGMLLLENVAGLLTANGGHAMGRVVHRLADLGYMGRWGVVRASDAGAPHQRARWFCVAWHSDLTRADTHAPSGASRRPTGESSCRPPTGFCVAEHTDRVAAAAPSARHGAAGVVRAGTERRDGVDRRPRGVAADTNDDGLQGVGRESADHREPRHDADRCGVRGVRGGAEATEWGRYAAAVHRWEHVLGRPAPRPVNDKRRLNPAFVEWMMGLPEGWVTDSDLSRTAQLKMLGNGVVPQQAALAWSMLGLGGDAAVTSGAVTLLPTPAVNDMGAGKTVEQWDAWTERMKAEHDNGNGHGRSLHIEAQRIGAAPRPRPRPRLRGTAHPE